MITYEKLSKKPNAFKSMIGLTICEFHELYREVKPAYKEAEMRRLSRPDRQRAPGAGTKFKLSLRDRLLMASMYLRLYPTTETLGFLFGVHKSTVSRNVRLLLPVLQALGQATLGWPAQEKRSKASLAEILTDYPDLVAIVDATEQRVQRPKDKDKQKKHYSGKKKCHTRKTQIVVSEQGLIRHASSSVPGSIHDLSLLRQTAVYDQLPEGVPLMGDNGYQGAQKDRTDLLIGLPCRNSRWHRLTAAEKAYNRVFSSIRIKVEHVIAQLKRFCILAERYRHRLADYDATFLAIVGLVNRRTRQRLRLSTTA